MQQPSFSRYRPALAAVALFAVLAFLWIFHATGVYRQIIMLWGVDVFDFPFLDTETVLSGARCLRAGVDVYVSNPCDTLGRVYDYSPLWMLLAYLPVTLAWGVPVGLIVACLYFGALGLLPAGRTARHQTAIAIGAVSSVAMFAMERGNNDLVLFALAAGAATLASRPAPNLRLAGYAFALLAGLLKYYPLAMLALATRERPARFAAVVLAAMLLTGLFVAIAWHDLTRALGLIPTGDYFGGMFGSVQVAGGLRQSFALSAGFVPVIRWTMTAVALGSGLYLASRAQTIAALDRLTMAERAFLLAGGLLTLGCFFTAQNIGYRAIHLLLALPPLLALRGTGSRLFHAAPSLTLAVLWSDCWRKGLLYAGKGIGPQARAALGLIGWGLREACWWWLIVLIAASIIALLWRSTLLARRPILWLA